jgi:hypothetical protein
VSLAQRFHAIFKARRIALATIDRPARRNDA